MSGKKYLGRRYMLVTVVACVSLVIALGSGSCRKSSKSTNSPLLTHMKLPSLQLPHHHFIIHRSKLFPPNL